MKQIASALVRAQRAFGPALKTSNNPHFRSRYADLAACVEAVIDALNTNGIFLLQKAYESETGVIVETVFLHESGESMECGKVAFPATKKDPQGFASALTYARRYSLMSACGIAPEDDDGNAASKSHHAPPARNAPPAQPVAPASTQGAASQPVAPAQPSAPALSDQLYTDLMEDTKALRMTDQQITAAATWASNGRTHRIADLAQIEAEKLAGAFAAKKTKGGVK